MQMRPEQSLFGQEIGVATASLNDADNAKFDAPRSTDFNGDTALEPVANSRLARLTSFAHVADDLNKHCLGIMTSTTKPKEPCFPSFHLVVCLMFLGCGSSQKTELLKGPSSSPCSSTERERVDQRQGQEHRWCEDQDGIINGPVAVFYTGGQQKVKFHMNHGRPDGPYKAWHPSGRWAVQSNYRHGQLTGAARFRPPHGPPSECQGQSCKGMQAVLDRPFCLLREIEIVFEMSKSKLNDCLGPKAPSKRAAFTAQWTITLAGRTIDIDIVAKNEADNSDVACLVAEVGHFKFPAPLGQKCHVSLDFELGYTKTPPDGETRL